tara:strand:- start:419 stop:946 length:528 start_codon:yes stop_codon:yes gene_type:complete
MNLLIKGKRNSQILIPKLVSNIQSIPIIEQRIKGFEHYLNLYNPATILTQTTITIKSEQHAIPELKKLLKNQFDGIFVPNSRSGLVVSNLSKNASIIGYDLTSENINLLKSEKLDFIISQQPERQGYMAIKRLFNKIISNERSTNKYFLPIDILTKENLDNYVNNQGDFDSDIGY